MWSIPKEGEMMSRIIQGLIEGERRGMTITVMPSYWRTTADFDCTWIRKYWALLRLPNPIRTDDQCLLLTSVFALGFSNELLRHAANPPPYRCSTQFGLSLLRDSIVCNFSSLVNSFTEDANNVTVVGRQVGFLGLSSIVPRMKS